MSQLLEQYTARNISKQLYDCKNKQDNEVAHIYYYVKGFVSLVVYVFRIISVF